MRVTGHHDALSFGHSTFFCPCWTFAGVFSALAQKSELAVLELGFRKQAEKLPSTLIKILKRMPTETNRWSCARLNVEILLVHANMRSVRGVWLLLISEGKILSFDHKKSF